MLIAARMLPLVLILSVWEITSRSNPRAAFLFSKPSDVVSTLTGDLVGGRLFNDLAVTMAEVLVGLAAASICGVAFGLLLGASERVASVLEPYVVALAAIPIFAVAPMTVIWFGTGFPAKVALVFLSTVFLAAFQTYSGVRSQSSPYSALFESFGATPGFLVRHILLPSSGVWILAACRLNVGFAILGAFVGEFIASNAGLGHYILRASGLYRVDAVLAGVVLLAMVSLGLSYTIKLAERVLFPWQSPRSQGA